MKKLLLSIFAISTAFASQAQCSELFISEYVEGWSNNKAIELYNPTDGAIDLVNYRLERYSNGSSSAATNQRYVLSGTIEPYSTFVIVVDKRNPDGEGQEAPVWDELQEKADLFANPVYEDNNTMYFNGNDAMVLRNISNGGNGFVIDVFGRIGEDPGNPTEGGGWNNVGPAFTWIANGAQAWTANRSLIRKPSIEIGDFVGNDPFDPSAQYDSIPPVVIGEEGFLQGNWASLGGHECVCNQTSSVSNAEKINARIFPVPAETGTAVRFAADVQMDRYDIYDLTGKLVKAERVQNAETFEINTSGLRAGIYFFQAFSGSTAYTQKFVLQ